MYSGCYYQPVCHLIIIRMNSACKSTCIHLRLMYGWIQDVHQLLSGAAYPTGCSQPVDYLLCKCTRTRMGWAYCIENVLVRGRASNPLHVVY